jgi:protein-tyrosine-phosphatase
MAAGFFREELARLGRTDVAVLSAGLDVGGESHHKGASPAAREAASEMGVDISDHEVRPLRPALLARADWVFVMEGSQIEKIASVLPEELDHVALLDPEGEDIEDPAGGGPETYREARDSIRAAAAARAAEVLREVAPRDDGAAA